jgi:hypothetical protein
LDPSDSIFTSTYVLAQKKSDTITLVAGDGDYVPPVRTLKDDGFKVEVVFWDHASHELKAVVGGGFFSLNHHLAHLALNPPQVHP